MEGDLGATAKATHEAHHALEQAIWNGGDDQQVSSATNALMAAEQNLISVQRKLAADILALLTPAQREQLKTELTKAPEEGMMGHGMMGHDHAVPPPPDQQ